MKQPPLGELALLLLSVVTVAQQRGQPLAITHVNVIDATGAPVRPDTTVIVNGERISAMGRRRPSRSPSGRAWWMDPASSSSRGSGTCTCIPLSPTGLPEAARHFCRCSSPTGSPGFATLGATCRNSRTAGGRSSPGGLLVRRSSLPGRCWMGRFPPFGGTRLRNGAERSGGAEFLVHWWAVRPCAGFSSSIGVATVDEAVRAVQALKRRGADFIKIQSTVSQPVFFAIVKEAHRLNLQVAGHVPDAVSAEDVADSGQNSIEHIGFLLVASADPEHRNGDRAKRREPWNHG